MTIPRSSARRTMRSLSAAGVRLPKFMAPRERIGGWPGCRLAIDGVEVDADGTACEATFDGADDDAIDGLVLRATYACPVGTETLGVTLYYLSTLPAGH